MAKAKLEGELVQMVDKLQGRMEEYGDLCARNEAQTKCLLVDPFLRALGWNTEDPRRVQVEYKVGRVRSKKDRQVDYALFKDKKLLALVEAKEFGRLAKEDDPETLLQLINYCTLKGAPLGILTDGGSWIVYDLAKSGTFSERAVCTIDFAGEAGDVAAASLALSFRNLCKLASGQTR